MKFKTLFPWITALFLCFAGICSADQGADKQMQIVQVKGLAGFAENEIPVIVPENGLLTVSIRDELNTYCVLTERVYPGTNKIKWDGLGWNEERLNKKTYTFSAEFSGDSGTVLYDETRMTMDVSRQALLFALPSADTVYLDQTEDWFVEFRMLLDDELITEFYSENEKTPEIICHHAFSGRRINICTFKVLIGNRSISPGTWRVRMYAKNNERYSKEFRLSICAGSLERIPVRTTGAILPDRQDSDQQIWEKMMMPSVVVDIGPTSHQKVYRTPDTHSAVLGTLHGQSQCLEVTEIRSEWAKIGAWNHESADYIEGWVPVSRLKTVQPQREYGLLLDKKEQTLTLFRDGKRVDTLLVSSGRIEPGEMYQETAAGAFLTDLHRADFSTNGLKYDYVIRYDGGNLLHQIPYAWGNEKKDYRAGSAYLGTKASHACVRIQAAPAEHGTNAYWLWTHLPYHTRLLILDDPEERAAEAAVINNTVPNLPALLTDSWRVRSESDELERRDCAVLTFGGDAVLGGREAYYRRSDSFPAIVEKNGLGYPFRNLTPLFEKDDCTSINLECVLKDDPAGEDKKKQWRFRGLTAYADVLPSASIELVNLANNHTIDYGEPGYLSTLEALDGKTAICGNARTALLEIRGHLFGFAGFRETNYLEDPNIIEQDLLSLKKQGAEYIICQCHWGTEYSETHNKLQEAMARSCVRAGADLVIGHHPHVVQGIQYVGNVPIVYSLGNLVFGGTIHLRTYDGLLVQAYFLLDGDKKEPVHLRLIPVLTSSTASKRENDYCPSIAAGEDRIRILTCIQRDTAFPLTDRVLLGE